ncbi:MAG: arginine repressor ArgR [Chloroflexota bacterium]
MSNKRERQAAIGQLVEGRAVGSQRELQSLLHQRGWDVTQATLSRDLRELRLARVPTANGTKYARTEGLSAEETPAALDTLLPQLFARIDGVGELAVLHTVAGGAQIVAETLDAERWPDVLGTIAGDDTILIICRSVEAREAFVRRVAGLSGR